MNINNINDNLDAKEQDPNKILKNQLLYNYYKEDNLPNFYPFFAFCLTHGKDLDLFYEHLSRAYQEGIRKQASQALKDQINAISKSTASQLIQYWLNYPNPEIYEEIRPLFQRDTSLIEIYNIFNPDEQKIEDLTDQQIEKIQAYVSPRPLLYMPIIRRLNILKNRKLENRINLNFFRIESNNKNFTYNKRSLLIFKNMLILDDPEKLWKRLLNGSIVILIDSFYNIESFKNWRPPFIMEQALFDIIIDLFDFSPWKVHESILLKTIDCSSKIWETYAFQIELNEMLLQIYPDFMFEFDEYSNQSMELSQNLTSDGRFKLDVFYRFDGSKYLLFTVRYNLVDNAMSTFAPYIQNKILKGYNFSLNLEMLLLLLKPMAQFNKNELSVLQEWVNKLSNKELETYKYQLFHQKVYKYSVFFIQLRNYLAKKVYELNIRIASNNAEINFLENIIEGKESVIEQAPAEEKRLVRIGIDFGASKTSISAKDVKTGRSLRAQGFIRTKPDGCVLAETEWGVSFDSILYYHKNKGFLIGECDYSDPDILYIIDDLKFCLRSNNTVITKQIDGEIYTVDRLLQIFFTEITRIIDFDKISIEEVYASVPIESIPEFWAIYAQILQKIFKLPPHKIKSFDEASAAAIGMYFINKSEIPLDKPILVVDLGGSTVDCGVISIDYTKMPVHVKIFAASSDILGGSVIDNQVFYELAKNDESIKHHDKNKVLGLIKLKKEALCGNAASDVKLKQFNISQINLKEITLEKIVARMNKIDYINKLISCVKNAIDFAYRNGSGPIEKIILTGNCFRFPLIKDVLMEELFKGSFKVKKHEPAIFYEKADSKFAISIGLIHIDSKIEFEGTISDIIATTIPNKNLEIATLISGGLKYPSSIYKISLAPVEKTSQIIFNPQIIRSIDIKAFNEEWEIGEKFADEFKRLFIIGDILRDPLIIEAENGNFAVYLKVDNLKNLVCYYKKNGKWIKRVLCSVR